MQKNCNTTRACSVSVGCGIMSFGMILVGVGKIVGKVNFPRMNSAAYSNSAAEEQTVGITVLM